MPKIKLDKEDVEAIKTLCDLTPLYDREIAELFGVSRGHVSKIRNKKRWNYDYGKDSTRANIEAIARRIHICR